MVQSVGYARISKRSSVYTKQLGYVDVTIKEILVHQNTRAERERERDSPCFDSSRARR